MGDGDGGEDSAEQPPDGAKLRRRRPQRTGADHRWRKAIQPERNKAARITVQPSGHVPQRSAQQDSKSDEWGAGKPNPKLRIWRDLKECHGSGGDQIPKW